MYSREISVLFCRIFFNSSSAYSFVEETVKTTTHQRNWYTIGSKDVRTYNLTEIDEKDAKLSLFYLIYLL